MSSFQHALPLHTSYSHCDNPQHSAVHRGAVALFLAVVLLTAWCVPRAAQAITILFEATDLAQPGPGGGDLWQYTYHVSDFPTPAANKAFEILFDLALYSDLQDPPPAVPDWDILVFQPDPNIPDPGRYAALALSDGASLAAPFTIEFVWLGAPGTTPGTQPFELNAYDADGNFVMTLASDLRTAPAQTAPVPEPASLVLLAVGLAGIVGWRGMTKHARW